MPMHFADDTNLVCTWTKLKNMIQQFNEDLAKIYAWVNAKRSYLNIDKTILCCLRLRILSIV